MRVLASLLPAVFRGLTKLKTHLVFMFMYFLGTGLIALVVKVLAGLGFGLVAYNLGGFALDTVYEKMQNALTDLPSDFLMLVKVARIDEAVSVLFGALSARLTFMGITAAGGRTNYHPVWRKPGNDVLPA
jgi:hypothetical protein